MIAVLSILKKIWPYLLIVALGLAIYGGFRYYSNKIEELSRQNAILQAQNAEINNNYNTLQNMYSISMKQVEELQKQQKESLNYVESLKQALNEVNLKEAYDKDSIKLLNDINDYEKCMAKNFKNPYKHCYEDKKNGTSK